MDYSFWTGSSNIALLALRAGSSHRHPRYSLKRPEARFPSQPELDEALERAYPPQLACLTTLHRRCTAAVPPVAFDNSSSTVDVSDRPRGYGTEIDPSFHMNPHCCCVGG